MYRVIWFVLLSLWGISAQAQEPAPEAAPYPLTPTAHDALLTHYFHSYDLQFAGWPDTQGAQTLAADSVRYALSQAAQDERLAFMARQTLSAATALQNPQTGDWVERTQRADWQRSAQGTGGLGSAAQALRLYATAARWHPEQYNNLIAKTKSYLLSLRAENGAFAAIPSPAPAPNVAPEERPPFRAQDAGRAASALLALYALSGDATLLTQAEQALRWAIQERRLAPGGFGSIDPTEPLALSDTQALAQAMFDLYLATGLPQWLSEAETTLNQIGEHLRDLRGGFIDTPDSEFRPWDANLGVAQLGGQLYHATHNMRYQALAEHALRFLLARFNPETCPAARVGELLLADAGLQQAPVRVTVIGYRDDPAAQTLYRAALHLPLIHRRLEWWDRREPIPNPDQEFPVLDHAAAYLCNPGCSGPLTSPETLASALVTPPPPPAIQPQTKPAP